MNQYAKGIFLPFLEKTSTKFNILAKSKKTWFLLKRVGLRLKYNLAANRGRFNTLKLVWQQAVDK